jgi:NTE family protein
VDGGVVSPVAVNTAKKYGADLIIAVDISTPMPGTAPTGTIETILQSVDVMYSRIAATQIDGADVVIRPNTRNIGSADFSKRHEAILEGEKAALAVLPDLLQKLRKLKAEGRL